LGELLHKTILLVVRQALRQRDLRVLGDDPDIYPAKPVGEIYQSEALQELKNVPLGCDGGVYQFLVVFPLDDVGKGVLQEIGLGIRLPKAPAVVEVGQQRAVVRCGR